MMHGRRNYYNLATRRLRGKRLLDSFPGEVSNTESRLEIFTIDSIKATHDLALNVTFVQEIVDLKEVWNAIVAPFKSSQKIKSQ